MASVSVPVGFYTAAVKQANILTEQQTPLVPLGVVIMALGAGRRRRGEERRSEGGVAR